MKIEDIFCNLPKIETHRLILRKMILEDAKDMFEYASDPEMVKYTIWDYHNSIEDSIRFLNSVIQKYEKKEVSEWGIVHKESKKLIGTCGYSCWYPVHACAEIAYALSKNYWNRGLMTEAVKEVIKFGFEKMVLNRIEARCAVKNIAPQRVLEKVGMTFEGIMREQMFAKGSYLNLRIYSILRKEYFGKGLI